MSCGRLPRSAWQACYLFKKSERPNFKGIMQIKHRCPAATTVWQEKLSTPHCQTAGVVPNTLLLFPEVLSPEKNTSRNKYERSENANLLAQFPSRNFLSVRGKKNKDHGMSVFLFIQTPNVFVVVFF